MVISNPGLDDDIRKSYKKYKQAQRILEERQEGCTQSDEGLILFEGLVYVPEQMRTEVIRQHRDVITSGHPGVHKTVEAVSRTYYFPHMRKRIEEYVRSCDICHKIKPARHKPYGMLRSPPTSARPWASIALDFVVKLPLSKEPNTGVEYDSILTIVDRLTKEIRMIPFKEESSAEELAYTFLRNMVALNGMPEEIITDSLASKFWTALTAQLGVNHKLSAAFHPQTDGQTDRRKE